MRSHQSARISSLNTATSNIQSAKFQRDGKDYTFKKLCHILLMSKNNFFAITNILNGDIQLSNEFYCVKSDNVNTIGFCDENVYSGYEKSNAMLRFYTFEKDNENYTETTLKQPNNVQCYNDELYKLLDNIDGPDTTYGLSIIEKYKYVLDNDDMRYSKIRALNENDIFNQITANNNVRIKISGCKIQHMEKYYNTIIETEKDKTNILNFEIFNNKRNIELFKYNKQNLSIHINTLLKNSLINKTNKDIDVSNSIKKILFHPFADANYVRDIFINDECVDTNLVFIYVIITYNCQKYHSILNEINKHNDLFK